MSAAHFLVGLQVNSNLVGPRHTNFLPATWPPPRDFPVVINAKGEVVCRYGDSIWNLTSWAKVACSINFGDGQTRGAKVSNENADVFRAVLAWWLWGPRACRTARGLQSQAEMLKPLFIACTEAGICAAELRRFPKVIEQVVSKLASTRQHEVLSKLHDLWAARDSLGFVILDEAGLAQFVSLASEKNSTQTAYIPPRIWTYQVQRLRECLDDFMNHRDKIEACYRFCLDAYAEVYGGGSREGAFFQTSTKRTPFHILGTHGTFRLTARRFGIEELLDRWVNASDQNGVKALPNYMGLITNVGLAYTVNFSLMRIDEACSLRANCYRVERDSIGEDIHLIGGVTTKTVQDGDAQWIVSPSVEVAIEAMKSIALLRLESAVHDTSLNISEDEKRNPMLLSWAYEPWVSKRRDRAARKRRIDYGLTFAQWPKLFDPEKLRVTKEDMALAQQMTFNLDPEKFGVGKVWPLGFHQLRRTGAVNMLSSGLVSDASLQYQLKHASRAMSRYYGQNYYRLKGTFDDETRGVYLKEMYSALVASLKNLRSDSFVSPHGEKRKAQLLSPISEKDHSGLIKDARDGRISYRENFLGGCANPGPCELGGISNISGCMGYGSEKPCEYVFLDREKKGRVVKLRDIFVAQQKNTLRDSPAWQSLQANIESAERALNDFDSL